VGSRAGVDISSSERKNNDLPGIELRYEAEEHLILTLRSFYSGRKITASFTDR
jgi:hypothetical protein